MTTSRLANQPAKIAWRVMKKCLRPLKLALSSPCERAANPYGTHIPVLIGLSRILEIEHVLELGCGQYSTVTFLNQSAFPRLLELRSLETDINWLNSVAKQITGDLRVKLQHVSGRMGSAVNGVELDNYDLAFIDDSATAEERAATICVVAAKHPVSTVVVIHDFEVPLYRQAAKSFAHHFKFDTFHPQTGIVWNGSGIRKKELKKLRSLIKGNTKDIEPDDINGWIQVLNNFK